MKNERPNAQRNFLKREQSKPEHKAPKRYIEVGMNSLHRTPESYIPVNRGSSNAPPQRIPRVDEVESTEPRKRGSMGKEGSAESFFLVLWCPRKEQIKSTGAMRYSSLRKPKETTKE